MIFLDIFEPNNIEDLIAQTTPVTRQSLNAKGLADYLFIGCDGHRIQIERKQIDEILSDLSGVEEQLGRELSNGVEETILLYEGTCEPVAGLKMATQSWKLAKKQRVMTPGRTYNVSYTGLQAWFSQLDKAGITIVHTCHYIGTAMAICALYANAQKEEHTTLRRYIKEHIMVQPFNPHVITLMGIKSGGVGEATAKALIERYGTAWYVLNQDADAIAETLIGGEDKKQKRLGLVGAKKLLNAIGRNV